MVGFNEISKVCHAAYFWTMMIYCASTRRDAMGIGIVPGCPLGAFPCGNESQCLEQKLWCDGLKDCDNEYDESYAPCHTIDGVPTFLKSHVTLDYIHNSSASRQQEDDSTCALTFYDERCSCVHHNRLNCKWQNFEVLPTALPKEMTIAMFQGNRIRLQSEMFESYNLSELIYIFLDDNFIDHIPNNTFDGLPKLGKLSLLGNKIRSLQKGMFAGLTSLTWLNLGENRIETIAAESLSDLPELHWLVLDNNLLTFEGLAEMRLPPKLGWLHLESNNLQLITSETFTGAPTLEDLLLKNNTISFITENAFNHLPNLISLDLSHNKLMELEPDLFFYNSKLSSLSVSFNKLTRLPVNIFAGTKNLTSLNLTGISIENIDPNMFNHLEDLQSIEFKSFQYCHYAIYVRNCSPKSDGLSSVENLLAIPAMRILIWVTAVSTLVGNAAVIISRLLIKQQHRRHSMFMRHLASSDLLMGVYLMIIAIQDIRMYNNYNKGALSWSTSSLCRMCGILAMTSSEVSLILLILMTAERFMAVVYPLKSSSVGFLQACTWLCLAWLTGLLLSILPLLTKDSLGGFYGSNAVCLPLHIYEPYRKGWVYSAFLFLGLNAVAYLTIAVFYVGMCRSIVTTRKSAYGATKKSDHTIICRFTAIIFTNTLCWLPISLIKLCALADVPIPKGTHAWLTVLILPVNSSLNPLIHSLTTPPFVKLFRRSFDACCYMFGRRSKEQSTSVALRPCANPRVSTNLTCEV